MEKKVIPIFYACDDAFVKYTIVSLSSMIENASKNYAYKIHVLYTNISDEMKTRLLALQNDNFTIEFVNVSEYLESVTNDLPVRHYYSKTTYYRFFISEMFDYDKAIYIDSDTIVLGDISELYNTDIGDSYLGACHEQAMAQVDVYGTYCEEVVGVSRNNFFNAGLMLINCNKFREKQVLNSFLYYLGEYNFVVTQDEDYLNLICKDHVFWLDQKWNTELTDGLEYDYDFKSANILHYIMVNKPWHYKNCRGADIFWKYASTTSVYSLIKGELDSYTDEQRENDARSAEHLAQMARDEIDRDDNYQKMLNEKKRSPYRVALLEKIAKYEKEGRFDEDVEDDPPSRMIMPDEIDYLRRSLGAKIKTAIAHKKAKIFLKTILDKKIMIIKDIKGVENFSSLSSGAIVTCNHFNAFDSFAIQEAYHASKQWPKRKFYRVIREGNYTSFPGFFGELMRHFYTLPLSSNIKTMAKFTDATNTLLQKGNFVLFYPEQAMWWNYRKPRPLKVGAYKFAIKNNVPVLPCFITMKDSDILGEDLRREIKDFDVSENFVPDGFYVQEYTIHVGEPIYARSDLSPRQNIEYLANRNFEVWKEIYEREYGMPLEY